MNMAWYEPLPIPDCCEHHAKLQYLLNGVRKIRKLQELARLAVEQRERQAYASIVEANRLSSPLLTNSSRPPVRPRRPPSLT